MDPFPIASVANAFLIATAFCFVTLLFATVADSEESATGLRERLTTWKKLRIEAGYLSESGRYQGGLYKHQRREELKIYNCTKHDTGRFCDSWNLTAATGDIEQKESCRCIRNHANTCCESWRCSRKASRPSNNTRNTASQEDAKVNCSCHRWSKDNTSCQTWDCRSDMDEGGGDYGETYQCEDTDAGGFCSRWNGTSRTRKDVGESLCRCTLSTGEYCAEWYCIARRLERCDQHPAGWCDLSLALIVGYSSGAVFLIVLVAASLHSVRQNHYFPLSLMIAMIAMSVVTLWGGTFALIYVLPFWMIVILPYPFYLMIRSSLWDPSDDDSTEPPYQRLSF